EGRELDALRREGGGRACDQLMSEDHRKDGGRARYRAAPTLDRDDRVLDRGAGVDDGVGGVGEALARRVGRRLVEIDLGGDRDDEDAALLRIEGRVDAGRIAAAMAIDDDRIAGIERLVVEELVDVV